MKQYTKLLSDILSEGRDKPPARANMPATKSLFGYQMRFDLQERFPILELRKLSFKNIVAELLWFLNGDTNIKFLVDNGCNIWNEDAYNYYVKTIKPFEDDSAMYESSLGNLYTKDDDSEFEIFTFEEFINHIKNAASKDELPYQELYKTYDKECELDNQWLTYTLGDCGFQYGKVWREIPIRQGEDFIDQIANLIRSISATPESRRHLLTSIIPQFQEEVALYWCHALAQFNCRPLTREEKEKYLQENPNFAPTRPHEERLNYVPDYYLDCHLYQRSGDAFLGVPYNIASYALLVHILCSTDENMNLIPGELIHTFGDVHLYANHFAQASEVINRSITHKDSPTKLKCEKFNWQDSLPDTANFGHFEVADFSLENYNPQPAIRAELSTGLIK